ncbi:MAG: acetyl-CoA carboxylase carboxyltransferase subunit alpha [Rhodobiaceae bacterium]|nr:acetyl-CoA carboxylase carboxyltransferase subunit alpha [Rhodobiaceae bacterium]
MLPYLEFEKTVADLDGKVAALKAQIAEGSAPANARDEIVKTEARAEQALKDIYAKLTPWQKTQVARHASRPHFTDYCKTLLDDFTPLSGDRYYGDDAAILGGFGWFGDRSVLFIGHEKGSDTQSRLEHNFGMARPEGYRKSVRLMRMAEKFGIPVVALVDTAGAYPGIGAEERGQAEAIAQSTACCLDLKVPNVAIIIGEGGSGGAIALATANRVFMLEHAIYSVISPEGAASILWRDSARAEDAATAMKLTAQDLEALKVIDGIVPEPVGGAHRDPAQAIANARDVISGALDALCSMDGDSLKTDRQERFLAIGRTLGQA